MLVVASLQMKAERKAMAGMGGPAQAMRRWRKQRLRQPFTITYAAGGSLMDMQPLWASVACGSVGYTARLVQRRSY